MSFASLAAVLIAGAGACFPDPEGEFEDYKARVANIGPTDNQTPSADASIDTKPPETAVDALYVGLCLAAGIVNNPDQALRFYTKTKFTPDGTGGGKLSLTVTPLVGWQNGDYVTPKSVSQSETRGDAISVPDLTVASGAGRFTAKLGTMHLPADANTLSGREAIIIDTVLDGRFGDPEFCTTLGGHLTTPYEYEFEPEQNICLFVKVNEGDPVPVKKGAEFVCPL